MKKLDLKNYEVVALDKPESKKFNGGGLGPLWWNSMIRAGLLSRWIITNRGYMENYMA
ncbi:MAG: hypothetical protein KGY70_15065 [Bacteroidales bacterium]|nr:hypothetical protein [Bacteroidales bacterium]